MVQDLWLPGTQFLYSVIFFFFFLLASVREVL